MKVFLSISSAQDLVSFFSQTFGSLYKWRRAAARRKTKSGKEWMCINMRKTKKLHKKKDKETNRYIWEVSLSSYVSLYTHIVRVFRPWILLILMLSLTYIERAYCAGETIGQKGDEKWGWPDKRSEEISRNRRSPFNVFDTVLLSLFVFFFLWFCFFFCERRRPTTT